MINNRNLFPLAARDIMNYAYCKRIVYFERVCHIRQTTTVKEVAGRTKHESENTLEKRRSNRRLFQWSRKPHNLELESAELGFRTILDLLLIDDSQGIAIPMQFKNAAYPGFVFRGQKEQILLESVLVEKKLGLSVPYALMKFLKDGRIIRVDTPDYKKYGFLENVGEINRMVASEQIPDATPHVKKCVDCCYRRICNRI